MNGQRPAAVVFTAAYQVVMGLIWLVMARQIGGMWMLFLIGFAVGHFTSAVGLYLLCEWGRQRAVQFAVFDIIGVVMHLLQATMSPWGALLTLGMPLYTLTALNDNEIKRHFS